MALSDDLRTRVVEAVVLARCRAMQRPSVYRSGRIEAHHDYLMGLIRA